MSVMSQTKFYYAMENFDKHFTSGGETDRQDRNGYPDRRHFYVIRLLERRLSTPTILWLSFSEASQTRRKYVFIIHFPGEDSSCGGTCRRLDTCFISFSVHFLH